MAEISETNLAVIIQSVLDEFRKASSNFPKFNSAHEGYAVLQEEVDELWEAIKLNQNRHPERDEQIQKEAIQVVAMGIRLLHDICMEE